MPVVIADRVRETSTVVGTGAYTGLAAVAAYRRFTAALSDGDQFPYVAWKGADWEVGLGTLTAGTIVRTSVQFSSNANAAVDWPAGQKTIVLDANATWLNQLAIQEQAATFTEVRGTEGTPLKLRGRHTASAVKTILTDQNDDPFIELLSDEDGLRIQVGGIIEQMPASGAGVPMTFRAQTTVSGEQHFRFEEQDGTGLFWMENHGLSGHHAHFGTGVDVVIADDLSATDGAFSGNISAATGRIGGLSGAAGGGEVFTVRTYEGSGRAGLRLRGDGANNSNFCGMLFLDRFGLESWNFVLDGALTYGGGYDLGFRRWGQSVDALALGADGASARVAYLTNGAAFTVGYNTLQSFAYSGRNQLFYNGAIVGTQAFSMASVWGTLPSGTDMWFDLNQTTGMNFASNILTQWYDAGYIANVTNPDVSLRRLSAGTLEIAGASGTGAGHLSVKGTVILGPYTDLTLPTAGTAGRIAFSSDSGLVYDSGTNWKKTTWSNV